MRRIAPIVTRDFLARLTLGFSVGETPAIGFPPPGRPELSSAVPSGALIETQRERRPAQPRTFVAIALATGLGAGFAPFAPGTFGALLAIPIFVLLSHSFWGLTLALGALMAAGIWAASEAERFFGREDDGRIVIDEVVGQLLALTPLFALPLESRTNVFAVVTAFVAFRGFDIAKPGPVRWAERRFEGGLGVMADDGVAGVLAAVGVAALIAGGVFA